MNDERSFERFVADNVAGDAGGIPLPDDFYDDMHTYATRTRKRPEWLALIKEPPMRISSSVAVGSPTVRVAAILVATLLITLMLAGAGIAGSRLLAADGPIVVDQSGGGDHTTITEAVAAADDGDEILVMPGTYVEGITISEDIVLRGDDRDSVVIAFAAKCQPDPEPRLPMHCPDDTPGFADGSPFGILVQDADPHISDLTLETPGNSSPIFVAGGAPVFERISVVGHELGEVFVVGGSRAEFHDSRFEGEFFVEDQSLVTLIGNQVAGGFAGAAAVIRDNELDNVLFSGPVTVTGNTVAPTPGGYREVGIGIEGDGWTFSNNTISGFDTGIKQLSGSGDIVGNTLIGNTTGMSVNVADGARVASNAVTGGDIGMLIRGSGIVEDNEVNGAATTGIQLRGSTTITLTGNTSCDNGEDLVMTTRAQPQMDDTNTFCNWAPTDG